MTAAAANRVIEQALALPKAKQRILLGRLWHQLEEGRAQPPSLEEIERRIAAVRNGTAVTYGAEEVRKSIDQRIKAGKAARKV